jgi:hypothetical protein
VGSLGNYYVGRKIGEIWGYTSNSLLQTDEEVAIANGVAVNNVYPAGSQMQLGNNWQKGDVKYVDFNGNGVSPGKNTLDDHDDRSIIGNNTPRYQYGITLGLAWKGIDVMVFFQGVGKRDLWDPAERDRFFGVNSMWTVPLQDASDYWTPENTGAFLPKPYIDVSDAVDPSSKNKQTSTRYLHDASYLRLKQLSLGYTLPNKWTQRISISKARIYVTGQNILTFTNLSKVFDPEIIGTAGSATGSTGIMNYPVAKTWSVGLNITF